MRPVTVLFADLTGFTELSNRLDPEAVGAVLDSYFEIADGLVARHGGTVDKHIGDCVMAVFGAPVAHADDARRALLAAIDIREDVAQLSRDRRLEGIGVHSGIASGTVMAAPSGSGVRRDYTVIGPSVNLAARLCDASETGEILVSGDLVRLLGGQFEFDAERQIEVSGYPEPVAVARVRGVSAADARVTFPLIGRRRELRQVTSLMEECLESRAGQVIYLRGDAGIGKTRLVEAIEDAGLTLGFTAVKTGVLEFGAGRTQDTGRLLAQGFLFLLPGALMGGAEAAIAQAIAQGAIADEDRVFCAELLGMPVPPDLEEYREELAPETRRRRRADLLGKLAAAAGRRGPLLVVVEDIHWADAEVLAGLGAVASAIASLPVVVLITGRPDTDPVDRAFRFAIGETPLATIDLRPLGAAEAAELVEAAGVGGGGAIADVVRRAEGNPLFLVQLALHLEDLTRGAMPSTIQSLVFARLDRLAAADKMALQIASVLGDRFSSADLRRLSEDNRLDLTRLVTAYLLRPVGDSYQFAHALIREAVYNSLPRSRRLALHASAAELFADRDRLLQAEHLERAEDPAAARLFLEIVREEVRLGNYSRALALNARGIAIAAADRDRSALVEQRGEVALATGDVAAARQAFDEALRLAPGAAERCRAEVGIAQCLRIVDRLAEAESMLAESEDRAKAAGLLLERSRIHHLRGNLMFPQGRLQECLAEHEAALDLAREAQSVDAEVAALGGLGDANYAIGRIRSARDIFAHCVELARASGHIRVALANAPMLAIVEALMGNARRSREIAENTLEEIMRAGAVRPEMICRHALFVHLIERGELEAARMQIDRADEIAVGLGSSRFHAENCAFLSWLLRYEGRREEALRVARDGLAPNDAGERFYVQPIVFGQIAAAGDDEQECEEALAQACEILDEGALSHCYYFFYRTMIEADIVGGRPDRARRWADRFDAVAAGEPFPWATYLSEWARGMAGHLGAGPRPDGKTLRQIADDGRRLGLLRLASLVPDAN